MGQSVTKACRLLLVAVGSSMLLTALLVSNSRLEAALLSDSSRTLGWGASLFRALFAIHGLALLVAALLWLRRAGEGSSLSPFRSLDQSTTSSTSNMKHPWAILIVLSLIALGLRMFRLNSDLWYDELLSLLDFFRPPLGEIVTSFASQNQHMFYSVLAHVSISLFGESAAAVRLPAVLFGVGSLWALFLLGRRIIGERESIFACALMTVSYHHIWFSQNARGYMPLLFFAILATWLWLEAQSRDEWGWWVAYAVAIALGTWSHMTMVFVVTTHALLYMSQIAYSFLLARIRRSTKQNPHVVLDVQKLSFRPLIAWILSGTLTLQLHALALPDFFRSALHMESLPSEWSSLGWVVIEGVRSLQLGFSGLAVVLCGALLMCVGWLSIMRSNFVAGTAMVLPALLGGSTMLALDHYLWPRFFFFSMGFALLIAIRGAFEIPRFTSRVIGGRTGELLIARAGVVLALLMITASALTVPRNYAFPKQDFSGARDYIESNRASDDAVIAVGLAGNAYRRYFAPQWRVAQTRVELDAARNGKDSWLVYTLPVEVRAYRPEVWQVIQGEFQVVKVFPGTLGGGDLFVCRSRNLDRPRLLVGL